MAQAALEATQGDLGRKESELKKARLSLGSTCGKLTESERTVERLRENRSGRFTYALTYLRLRKSLLQELKAAKEVLISSLRNVQDLEVESQKVPKLEARIQQLEGASTKRRSESWSSLSGRN